MAELIDDKRAKLPAGGGPFVLPEPVEVGRQIAGLGRVVAELGDEYLFRAAEPTPQGYTVLAAEAFASAGSSVAQAASALGAVAQQLAFIARTANMHDEPRYQEARALAYGTAEYAVETARDDLAEATQILRAAAAEISLPQVRTRHNSVTRSPRTAPATQPSPAADRAADERPAPDGGSAERADRPAPSVRVNAALSRSAVLPPASRSGQPPSAVAEFGTQGTAPALLPASPRRRSAP
ncbi:hypothetical protein [Streptomyces sp. TLI_171]|uniref:hypothetical protein n=1 Tax=Streptomyces sp. TLI_171 TaxID=1938859 RepID=UPI00117FC0F7|nr:hypothetical protein [Streptomyces sp. TLI_171]